MIEGPDIQAQANSELSPELGAVLYEITMITMKCREVMDRLPKTPTRHRAKAQASVARDIHRRTELLKQEGVKIAYIDQFILELKHEEINMSELIDITKSAIDLGMMTADKNHNEEIDLKTVEHIEDKDPNVNTKLIELQQLIQESAARLLNT